MYMYIYFLMIGYITCFDMPKTWLNPADLHHSRNVENIQEPSELQLNEDAVTKPKIDKESTPVNNNLSCVCPILAKSPCNSYLKRMINLLLTEAHVKNYRLPKGESRIVPLTLQFSSDSLEIMHSLASKENLEQFSWSDLDEAFSSIFDKSEITVQEKYINKESLNQHDYTYFIFISTVGITLFIGFWLLLTSGSFYKSVCGIALLNFAIALVWNLIRAYNREKDKILQMKHNKFKSSHPSSYLESLIAPFKRLFGSVEAIDPFVSENDPMFNLDYGKIVIETISSILHVLPILGQNCGEMVVNFFGQQSYIMQYLIQPAMFLVIPLIFCVVILIVAIIFKGVSIKLPFFMVAIGGKESSNSPPVTPSLTNRSEQDPTAILSREQNIASFSGTSSANVSQVRRIITEFHPYRMDSFSKVRDSPEIPPSVITRKGRIKRNRQPKRVYKIESSC